MAVEEGAPRLVDRGLEVVPEHRWVGGGVADQREHHEQRGQPTAPKEEAELQRLDQAPRENAEAHVSSSARMQPAARNGPNGSAVPRASLPWRRRSASATGNIASEASSSASGTCLPSAAPMSRPSLTSPMPTARGLIRVGMKKNRAVARAAPIQIGACSGKKASWATSTIAAAGSTIRFGSKRVWMSMAASTRSTTAVKASISPRAPNPKWVSISAAAMLAAAPTSARRRRSGRTSAAAVGPASVLEDCKARTPIPVRAGVSLVNLRDEPFGRAPLRARVEAVEPGRAGVLGDDQHSHGALEALECVHQARDHQRRTGGIDEHHITPRALGCLRHVDRPLGNVDQ